MTEYDSSRTLYRTSKNRFWPPELADFCWEICSSSPAAWYSRSPRCATSINGETDWRGNLGQIIVPKQVWKFPAHDPFILLLGSRNIIFAGIVLSIRGTYTSWIFKDQCKACFWLVSLWKPSRENLLCRRRSRRNFVPESDRGHPLKEAEASFRG